MIGLIVCARFVVQSSNSISHNDSLEFCPLSKLPSFSFPLGLSYPGLPLILSSPGLPRDSIASVFEQSLLAFERCYMCGSEFGLHFSPLLDFEGCLPPRDPPSSSPQSLQACAMPPFTLCSSYPFYFVYLHLSFFLLSGL